MTPSVFVGLTIISADYAGQQSVHVLDRRSGRLVLRSAIEPLARSFVLPERSGVGTARARAGGLALEFEATAAGTTLSAEAPGISLRAQVGPGGDSLGVVVPWSDTRFQYTLKDVGRPVRGTIALDGEEIAFDEADGSFAVLDHGRGRWPYSMTWNWAAGFGEVAGRRIGVQLGGRWTEGTGQTENGLFVDGRLHKVEQDLAWTYDSANWLAPWRIRGTRVDVTFAPAHVRADRTNLGVVASEVHQCFGVFTGWMLDDSDQRVSVDGVAGWAEEARNRW
jgi:hypothetical protein